MAQKRLSGKLVDGAIANADVRVYALDARGTKGRLLAKDVRTDPSGAYQLEVQHGGAVLVECSGGTFRDWATGRTISLSQSQTLRAVIPDVAADTKANVTPLTHIAAGRATETAKAGGDLKDAVTSANAAIEAHFGVADILGTDIPDLTTSGEAVGADQRALNYAFVLGGVSQTAAALKCNSPYDLVAAAADDASDGKFDGKQGATQILIPTQTGSVALPAATFTAELSAAISAFQQSAQNVSDTRCSDDILAKLDASSGELVGSGGMTYADGGSGGGSGTNGGGSGTNGGGSGTNGGGSGTNGGGSGTNGGGSGSVGGGSGSVGGGSGSVGGGSGSVGGGSGSVGGGSGSVGGGSGSVGGGSGSVGGGTGSLGGGTGSVGGGTGSVGGGSGSVGGGTGSVGGGTGSVGGGTGSVGGGTGSVGGGTGGGTGTTSDAGTSTTDAGTSTTDAGTTTTDAGTTTTDAGTTTTDAGTTTTDAGTTTTDAGTSTTDAGTTTTDAGTATTDAGMVALSTSSLTFGAGGLVDCGTQAAPQVVSVTNNSSQTLTFTLTLAGNTNSPYTVSGPSMLVAGGSATLTVTPKTMPATSSTLPDGFADTLSIGASDGAVNETHTIALHQTARGAVLSLNPTSISFAVSAGGSQTHNFTVNNAGNLAAAFSLTVGGTNAGDFTLDQTSGTVTGNFAGTATFSAGSGGLAGTRTGNVSLSTSSVLCAPLPTALALSGTIN